MRSQKRPRKATVRRFILRKTVRGLFRKLPLFAVALLAMWLLTTLDRVRVTHGITNGRDGETAFEINDSFLRQARRVDDVLQEWLYDPSRFKYHKFSNRRQLLDALAAKAMVVRDELRAPLDSEKRKALESQHKAREALEAAQDGLDKGPANKRERLRLEKVIAEKEIEITKKQAKLEEIDPKINELEKKFKATTDLIYKDFAEDLPDILVEAEKRKIGFFDDFLEDSLIDDKNSLHVVYHVFRISALIIVILSFIFILVMLFQQLPLAGGTDTVSEQLKALISMKSAGVGGEIAKTAIVSVTALGVGTAVLVGTNTLSVTPPHNPPPIEMGTPRVRGSFLPPIDVSWDPVTKEYLQQSFITNGGSYAPYSKQTVFNGSQEPPIFEPKIEVPPAVVIHTRIPDTAGTQAILNQLTSLVTNLKSAPNVDDLRARINSIEAQVKALLTPECKCEATLTAISKHLYQIREAIAGPVSDQTSSISTPDPPALFPFSLSVSSPTQKNSDTVVGALKSTTEALGAIENQLKAIRADGLVNRASNSGNVFTRSGQFFGSELYGITDQVLQTLNEVMKGNPNHKDFMDALGSMKGQAPQNKDEFIRTLRSSLTGNLTGDQKNNLLESLKPWERVILSYARLRS